MASLTTTNKPLDPGAWPPPAAAGPQAKAGSSTYGQILKSSALVGGSSVVNIVLSMVRTKAFALLLGPAGVGIMGLYQSITDLTRTVAGMGINTSGVRQISEAVGSCDSLRIARTVATLRRVAFLLGAIGALLLVLLCQPISRLAFNDHGHAWAVALLGLAVFFGAVSAGQLALLQGMRRIADLALANVWGSLYETVLGILLVYYYRQRAIAASIVVIAAMAIFTSWWYARKVKMEPVRLKLGEIMSEASGLLKFGIVFMASSLMAMGVAVLARIILMRKFGENETGYYQAAWSIGGLYLGIILQAMGADFFPRLTAVAGNNRECNRLVNEQAEVGLLLAGPGVLGTLTFAPLAIEIFYSSKFGPTVEILRWISLGMLLRVASWPMGFILLAKGARRPFLCSEVVSTVVQVTLLWYGVRAFGLDGSGMAFFGTYVVYWCLIYAIVRSVSGFRWSSENKQIGLLLGALIAVLFTGWYVLPRPIFYAGGAVITLVAGIYSLKRLCALVPLDRLPGPIQRLARLLRLAPSSSLES